MITLYSKKRRLKFFFFIDVRSIIKLTELRQAHSTLILNPHISLFKFAKIIGVIFDFEAHLTPGGPVIVLAVCILNF